MYAEHFGVYGVRKVWRQLRREGVAVARCTVARLMRRLGLQGVVRGRRAKTTHSVVQGERPDDRVNREFKVSRPNALWVSDPRFHHSGAGSDPPFPRGQALCGDVAGVRSTRPSSSTPMRGVSWAGGVSNSLHTDLALDALEQALHERRAPREGLIHHSVRGVQYLSLRYTERLVQMGIAPSVGSVGDSYDNALAESIIGAVQDGTHRTARAVASLRGGGTRHPRMGALVQPPAPVRTPRVCASG